MEDTLTSSIEGQTVMHVSLENKNVEIAVDKYTMAHSLRTHTHISFDATYFQICKDFLSLD